MYILSTPSTMSNPKRNANYLLNLTIEERNYLHKQADKLEMSLAAFIRLNLLAGASLSKTACTADLEQSNP